MKPTIHDVMPITYDVAIIMIPPRGGEYRDTMRWRSVVNALLPNFPEDHRNHTKFHLHALDLIIEMSSGWEPAAGDQRFFESLSTLYNNYRESEYIASKTLYDLGVILVGAGYSIDEWRKRFDEKFVNLEEEVA